MTIKAIKRPTREKQAAADFICFLTKKEALIYNSKLITEIKDKLQVSANRGRITWLTWNLLGTLY